MKNFLDGSFEVHGIKNEGVIGRVQVDYSLNKFSPCNYVRMNPLEYEGDVRNAMYGIDNGITSVEEMLKLKY